MNAEDRTRGLDGIGREIVASLLFLTRVPARWLGADGSALPDLRSAIRAFPIAGALIGAAGGLVLMLANALNLPPLAAALVAVAALVMVTGALHEDGLADTADGFGGGHSVNDRLAIMRDSRIGSYGALALVLSVLLRSSLLASFLPLAPFAGFAALVAAETIGRAALLHHWARLPSARPDGLAGRIGRPEGAPLRMGLVAALAIAVVAGTLAGGPIAALMAIAAAILATLAFGSLALRTIGGHTGDTLGAVEQIAGLGALLALVAFR